MDKSCRIVSSSDSPQWCALSQLIFITYTNSCRTSYENRFIVKFSDDTALLSLLYGPVLPEFVKWRDDNYLNLNVRPSIHPFSLFGNSVLWFLVSLVYFFPYILLVHKEPAVTHTLKTSTTPTEGRFGNQLYLYSVSRDWRGLWNIFDCKAFSAYKGRKWSNELHHVF